MIFLQDNQKLSKNQNDNIEVAQTSRDSRRI
jgi:hypothetical protein